MIKVTVMYFYAEGACFNHNYYRGRHMLLAKAQPGNVCTYYTVDKNLAGGMPGMPPAYVAICTFVCESANIFQAVMKQYDAEILVDIINYTDIAPALQTSETVVERLDC